jgi:hypothetical protein
VRRAAVVISVIVAAIGIAVPPQASADPFGYPNPGQIADGADHWFCHTPSIAGDETRIADAMTILDAQTDMYDAFAGSTCGTSTDVVWVRDDGLTDAIFGGSGSVSLRGATLCVRWATWGVCDQAWVIYNRLEMFYNTVNNTSGADVGPNYDVNVRKTLGHELGHTAGLSHNNGADAAPCGSPLPGPADPMRSSWVVTNTVFHWYNAHHIDCHINPTY